MAITTTVPFRRVVGELIRGVADGTTGVPRGIPLAEAQVTFDALIDSAVKGELVIFDTVQAVTDSNAILRNPETNEPGIWLVPTNDPTVGATGWTWHVTVSTPSSGILYEFDMTVPSGATDLDLADVMPVPGNIGEAVLVWEQAVLQTAQNAADALSYRNTALSYRDQTNTHRANAVTAQNNAYGARDAALASATAAALSASMVQDAVMRAPSMIFNGGFELGTGAAATGWTLVAANADRVAANAYRGSASMLLPQSGNVSEILSDSAPTEGNRWVRLSAMYRTSSDSASLGGLRIQYSSNGTTWTQLGASPAFPHSAAWASFEIRRQIPAGALFVRARIAAVPNSPTIRLDEVRLDDITELVAAETAAAAANTAYQNSTQSLAITGGDTLTATRVNGTTYTVGKVTVPGPPGPAGKMTGNGDNMVIDPNILGTLAENWAATVAGVDAYISKTTVTGAPGNAIRLSGPSVRMKNLNVIQAMPGETFWLGGMIQNQATAGSLYLQIIERTSAGGHNGARSVRIGAQSWSNVGGYVKVINANNATAYLEFELATSPDFAGQAWLTGLEMRSTLRTSEVTTETLNALETRKGRTAVFVGNSNVVGGTGKWSTMLCAEMGWTERNYAIGGQSTANGQYLAQLTAARDSGLFVNDEVGIVFIADVSNDTRAKNSAVAANAPTLLAQARAWFPNARIVVIPLLWPANPRDAPPEIGGYQEDWWRFVNQHAAELRTMSAAAGAEFVDWSWTWHIGLLSTQIPAEVHFTTEGHRLIADNVKKFLRGETDTRSRTRWTPVVARANYNSTGGGALRGLEVIRNGVEVEIAGQISPTINVSAGWTWADIPFGFRPAQRADLMIYANTLDTPAPVFINYDGTLVVNKAYSSGQILVFRAQYRID